MLGVKAENTGGRLWLRMAARKMRHLSLVCIWGTPYGMTSFESCTTLERLF
jgi:hypothetical protein